MADNKHSVVRTDLMAGTRLESELRSVRFYDAQGKVAAIDNGAVVKIEALEVVDNVAAREVWKAVAPAANTDLADVVLIASPEVMYDERLNALTDFYNEAGKPARGYKLHKNDIFSVTADALDGTATVGYEVELQAGTKMKVAASATGTKVGKVIALNTVGALEYVVIQVA